MFSFLFCNYTRCQLLSISENLQLVKAVVCAGLYPNVAKLKNVPKSLHKYVAKSFQITEQIIDYVVNVALLLLKKYMGEIVFRQNKIWIVS